MLGRLVEAVLADLLNIHVVLPESKLAFRLQRRREDCQKLRLIFSEVGGWLRVVHSEELGLDRTVLQLLVLNLRDGLKSQLYIRPIIYVEHL